MPTFRIITLGCKVNQAESEAVSRQLSESHWRPAAAAEAADVCIINTCAVTHKAAMQSRQAVRHAIHTNSRAFVLATGCYAATDPEALAKIDGLNHIVAPSGKERLAEFIHTCGLRSCAGAATTGAPAQAECQAVSGQAPAAGARSRPFLKVQDGCNAFCTYCIVPHARGRSRSLALPAVIDSIGVLDRRGYQEVVLTGIHLGSYGKDLTPPSSLYDLLKAIETLPSQIRVRLSSIEPLELTDEIIERLAGSERFCRHVHIPLQSGDADILKKMRRPYSPEFFCRLVEKIRSCLPDAAIGADVLVGFPGESDAAFENTFRSVEALPLSYIHVFPFSARPGTAAYHFPRKVPPDLIRQRCRRLRLLGGQKRYRFYQAFVGQTVEVVVESRRDPKSGQLKAVSSNYLSVLFAGEDGLMNRKARVSLTEFRAGCLQGMLANAAADQKFPVQSQAAGRRDDA